jgi:glycosyltransferase involved in cell wall biosynthesis
VTDVGGNAEIVRDGSTGLVVPPGDPVALADAIGKLAASPALARKMGAAGKARLAREFTLESMVRRNEEVYDEILARGRRAGPE